MSINLFIDIETIPTQDPEIVAKISENIKPPSNYKTPEVIEKWYANKEPEAFDKKLRETALVGAVGEVICISWAIDDGEIRHIYRRKEESEAAMLIDFMIALNDMIPVERSGKKQAAVTWVGHYITGFDLRFLWQSYVKHGIKPIVDIPYKAKPWDREVFDTKVEWSGLSSTAPKGYASLDALSHTFSLKVKGDITGATVWDAIQAGRYEDVAEYCDDDVERVRGIYKMMHFA